MAETPPLTDIASHFRFGENWASFAQTLDEAAIAAAVAGLGRLVPPPALAGARFLDIGCGAGLSLLAALRLGAAAVTGIDIDAASVATSRAVLTQHAPGEPWRLEQASVFDLTPDALGRFDIVHSWGVLHHTGDLWAALAQAALLVEPGGLFALALYRRTPLCGFWRVVKRFYARAGAGQRRLLRGPYKALYAARLLAHGTNPRRYIRDYRTLRGMDWRHDVEDWLGGYPYQSVLPDGVRAHLHAAGFVLERLFENAAGCKGLVGTGCDEFLARRIESS